MTDFSPLLIYQYAETFLAVVRFELRAQMQRNDATQLLQSHKPLINTVGNYYRMFVTL